MTKLFYAGLRAAVLLFSVFPAFSFAASPMEAPLARSPDVESLHLQAFAKAEGRKTLAEALDEARPLPTNGEKLLHLTRRAQALWLAGNIHDSRQLFKELANLALEDDWREAQRSSIAYSLLRLAQTSSTPNERSEWLEKLASQFPDVALSSDAFPPPLLEELEKAKQAAKKSFIEVALGEKFADYRFILINGQSFTIDARKRIKVPPGFFRLTALSDAKPPFTEKISAGELLQLRLVSSWLVGGSCATPVISESKSVPSNVEALFPNNCLQSSLKKKGLTLNSGREKSADVLGEVTWPTQEPQQAPVISKRTWWMIGATAVVTGVVFGLSKMSERKVEPTTRQGF